MPEPTDEAVERLGITGGARPDVDRAFADLANKFGKKRDGRKLPQYLRNDETVLALAGGLTNRRNGLLVATTQRALFVAEGIVNHSVEDFPYARITSVAVSRSLAFAKLSIQAAGSHHLIEQMNKREAENVASIIRNAQQGAVASQPLVLPPVPSVAAQPAPDFIAQLERLAALRDSGVLTPEEFADQKAKLLR